MCLLQLYKTYIRQYFKENWNLYQCKIIKTLVYVSPCKQALTLSTPAFWYYVKHQGGEEKARPLGIALRAVKMRARWWYHNY